MACTAFSDGISVMSNERIPSIEPPDMIGRGGLTRLLVILALLLTFLAIVGIYLTYRPRPFNPVRWQTATSNERGRMLSSLMKQTDFIGFTRDEVQVYLGSADFDQRLFWYDLGPETGDDPVDPRADVGDPRRLYGVFRQDVAGLILEVLYSHRRPLLGSQPYDSTAWFNGTPAERRTMFTNALGRIRSTGLTRANVIAILGEPDGHRVRGEYNVGPGSSPYGTPRALILDYNDQDIVDTSFIQ